MSLSLRRLSRSYSVDNNLLLLSLLIAGPIVLFLVMQLLGATKKINKAAMRAQWAKARSLASNTEPQFAIIEADKVFDSALKQLGFRGETMGDRLKNAQSSIRNINDIWTAHKLRNKLVHEADVKVTKRDIQAALSSYEKALKQMGAL